MNNANRLNTCFVCGHRLLANEGFPFENSRLLRHRSCSKQRLVLELRERAETLGLTSLDLLTRRLAELQERLLQALGQVQLADNKAIHVNQNNPLKSSHEFSNPRKAELYVQPDVEGASSCEPVAYGIDAVLARKVIKAAR